MMRTVFIVLSKELREGVRDRRSMLAAIAGTLAGPLLVGVIIAMAARDRVSTGALSVAVAGAPHAPALVQRLAEERVVIRPAPADLEGDVRAGRVEVGLVIPPDYPTRYAAVRTATVRVVADPTRSGSRDAARRLRDVIARYARQVSTVRLIARGVNPDVSSPIRVEDVDVSTERARAAVALSVLPVFLLVSTFAMGMGVAIDATAGERERRSLEPLLLTGASSVAIGAGKWAATAVLNVAGLLLTLGCAAGILTRLPLEDLGVRLDSLGLLAIGVMIAGVPLALLAAALQLSAATHARSFREGQTYLSMLLFVPMIAGMLLAFSRTPTTPWHLAVPVLAQHQLIAAVLRGETPGRLAIALPAIVAIAMTCLLLRRVGVQLSSDRILYG